MNNKRILISKSGFGAGFTIFMIAAYLFQIGYLLNNSTYQLFIKVPFFVAVLYIFINIKRFKPNTTVVFLLLYSASMVVSVVLTSDITLNIIMLISMQLFCIMSISLISQKGVLGAAVKGLLLYFFLSCLINDVIWVMHGFHPLVEGNSRISLLPQFFIGNKFAVMYHHIFLLFLILTLYKGHHRKKMIITFSLILIVLSFSFDCSTTAVASFACMIMLLIEGRKKSFLESKMTIVCALLAGIVFPFVIEVVMSIDFIQHIVVSLLGRSLTLTGRVNIFTHIVPLIKYNFFWGIGQNSGTSLITVASGAANIQNGFWQVAITYGMVSAILLTCAVLSLDTRIDNSDTKLHGYTMLVMIYVFILIGFVEITYGMTLLMPVAIYSELSERKGEI